MEVVEEPEVVEPVKPASLRDRLAKARLAFSGAVVGVLGRSGITEESFEDLEEALLRADVGVGVTTDLLDGLRAKVASKEITEPQALVDELEAEMVSRLAGSDRTLAFEPGRRRPERVDVRRGQRRRARPRRSASSPTSRCVTVAPCSWRRATRSARQRRSSSRPGPSGRAPRSSAGPKVGIPVR